MYTGGMVQSGLIGGILNQQGPPQVQAEQVAGGVVNRAMAVGAPIAGLGAGLLGLDPISMGIKGFGIGTKLGGGAVGGMAAGLGMAGVAGAGAMAVGYGAEQIYTGMQQQQQLQQSLRSSFNFATPQGRGFSTPQMGAIGGVMRQMAGEVGPAGEMTNMRELTTLASRMGQMGMATGVRDVQQFTQKFREMVTTLKTVAREMGTSLEVAQEFVSSMRGSGIFRAGDQSRMAQEMRQFSVSGNLAISELSAMGNIGSQISRAVGGRGRQGMAAGVRTLGNIGNALQAGTLTEEDIYNATGLTGAEGRQAMATSQLQQSAKFLQGSKGRWFLASVAGKGGELDPSSVAAWESGDVSVGETRGMAGKNLSRVGRANFIRNEGRLRGAAMEQFGGNLPVMALMKWVGDRGINIDDMGDNDRAMLFASRQLGIPMDELEGMVKQVKGLPAARRQEALSKDSDSFMRRQAMMRRTQGLEGIKRGFEQAREKVNSHLQQIGADFYSDLTNDVESMINQMTGVTADHVSRDIHESYQRASMGGGKGALAKSFGIGAKLSKGALAFGAHTPGAGQGAAGSWKEFTATGPGRMLGLGGESGLDKMKAAGWGGAFGGISMFNTTEAERDATFTAKMDEITKARAATQGPADARGLMVGQMMKDQIREWYSSGGLSNKTGLDRVDDFQKRLEEGAAKGDRHAQAALLEFNAKPDMASRFALVQAAEQQGGIPEAVQLKNKSELPDTLGGMGGGAYATLGDQASDYGKKFIGGGKWGREAKKVGTAVGTFWALPFGAAAPVMGRFMGTLAEKGAEWISGETTGAQQKEAADWLMSDEGRKLSSGLMAQSEAEQETARQAIQDKLMTADKEGGLAKGLRAALVAHDVMKATTANNGQPPDEKTMEDIARKHGLEGGAQQARSSTQLLNKAVSQQWESDVRAIARSRGEAARPKFESLVRTGVVTRGEGGEYGLNASLLAQVEKTGGKAARTALEQSFMATATEAKLGLGGGVAAEAAGIEKATGHASSAFTNVWTMNEKAARATAKQLDEAGVPELGGMFREVAGLKTRASRALRRGPGGVASMLGISGIDRGEQKELWALAGKSPEGALAASKKMLAHLDTSKLSEEERSRLTGEMSDILALQGKRGGTAKEIVARQEEAKTRLGQLAADRSAGSAGAALAKAQEETQRGKVKQENPLMSDIADATKSTSEAIKLLTPDAIAGALAGKLTGSVMNVKILGGLFGGSTPPPAATPTE